MRRRRSRFAVVLLGLSSPALVAAANLDSVPDAVVFTDVNVVPLDRERVLRGYTVVTHGGRVTALAKAGAITPPPGARIIAGRGRYLLPGLTDAHVHLDPLIGARPEFGDAPLYLAHGITTVVNLRGDPSHLRWKREIAAGRLLAPNLLTAGEFVNEPRVRSPEEVVREVRAQKRAGYDVIKYHQVLDPRRGGYATTRGLDAPSYLRLNQVARQEGIPLVGHAPVNLGLDALLRARQPLAHIGELAALHFLPTWRQREYLLATGLGLGALALAAVAWGVGWGLRRLRRRGPRDGAGPAAGRRLPWLGGALLAAGVGALAMGVALTPGGAWRGSMTALVAYTVLVAALAVGALASAVATVGAWRTRGARWDARILGPLVTLGAATLVLCASARWLPVAWRSSDAGIRSVAERLAGASVAVQSTLVIYESLSRADRIAAHPSFRALPPRLQQRWRRFRPRLPWWWGLVWGRYAEFTRDVARALHRAGVPLVAGTDAMGVPLLTPGASLQRELLLLRRAGLSAYEVLRSATVAPARLFGLSGAHGKVVIGAPADLLLVRDNPLERLATLERPEGVMVRGRWLPREKLAAMVARLARPPGG